MEVKQKEERKLIKSAKRTKEGSRAASSLLTPIGNTSYVPDNRLEPELAFIPVPKTSTKDNDINGTETGNKQTTVILLEEPDDGEGWDTDLEDVKSYPNRRSVDIDERSRVVYIRACIKFNITPSSKFLRSMKDGHVNLSNQGLGPIGTQAIAISLVVDQRVKDINLSGNSVGKTGIKYIAEMLKDGDNVVQHIDLSDNDLGSYGARVLGNMLEKNDSLLTLKVSGNAFGANDAVFFANAIGTYRFPVKVLDLSHNNFAEEGARKLGPAIASNDSIESLNISWNNLRLEGINAIAEGLKENSSIKRLDVSWNGIGDGGSLLLAKALVGNETLEKLNLEGNRINPEGLQQAVHALVPNKSVTELKFSKNPVTAAGPIIALTIIKAHPEIGLESLDFEDIWVCSDVVQLLEEVIVIKPNFKLKHAGFINASDIIKASVKKRQDDTLNDPFMFLINYVTEHKLRWLDLFNRLDSDKNFGVSLQEFRDGMKKTGIPLSDRDVERLIERLDTDGNGEIDFGELLDGQKRYMKRLEKIVGNGSASEQVESRQQSRPSSEQQSRSSSRQQSRPSSSQQSRPSSNQQSRPSSKYQSERTQSDADGSDAPQMIPRDADQLDVNNYNTAMTEPVAV